MVTTQRIQEYADRIAARFRPERIILFGSYAYGTPTEDSDVDLLVVMPFEGRERAKALEIKRVIGVECSMDLLVYDPESLQRRYDLEDWFVRDVLDKGQTLYESHHAGMGGESRTGLEQSRT